MICQNISDAFQIDENVRKKTHALRFRACVFSVNILFFLTASLWFSSWEKALHRHQRGNDAFRPAVKTFGIPVIEQSGAVRRGCGHLRDALP